MRVRVVFQGEEPVILPWNYPHLLHGYLYGAIARANPEFGTFLHEEGFTAGNHRYKMLVFSKIFSRESRALPQGLKVMPPLEWWFSSPLDAPIEALVKTLVLEGEVRLGNIRLYIEKVEVEGIPDISERMLCETISPVVASTGTKKEGRLVKRFLSPDDEDFRRVIEVNLLRKAKALGITFDHTININIEPVGKWRSRLFTVQGTNVKGYEGRFVIEGDKNLIQLAYEAGIGERNSQGFGMFRFVKSG
ncbi:CRISPR-associated endoribonuclease Cas6 [Thermovorax subterraneus]|nr:CRISPR-associated endoribonuclease Cas6 [Thermovorax subterraneus]